VGLCGRPQLHKICTQTHNKVKYAKWKANCLGRGPSFGWGCGKAPKSIFQLSYHLELFSRAHTHTQERQTHKPIYKHHREFCLRADYFFIFNFNVFIHRQRRRRRRTLKPLVKNLHLNEAQRRLTDGPVSLLSLKVEIFMIAVTAKLSVDKGECASLSVYAWVCPLCECVCLCIKCKYTRLYE